MLNLKTLGWEKIDWFGGLAKSGFDAMVYAEGPKYASFNNFEDETRQNGRSFIYFNDSSSL